MDEIIKQAEKLGAAIAAHARCTALKQAGAGLRGDEEAQALEKEHAQAAKVLEEKAAAGRPLEPEEKRREADLRASLAQNRVVSDFLRAQADFQELMHEVDRALGSAIDLD